MAYKFTLEVAEGASHSECGSCHETAKNGHGFVYKNNDAFAVYFLSWTETHREKHVDTAIAIGEWGDETLQKDRVGFCLQIRENDDRIEYQILDPNDSPWPKTELWGESLSREKALAHDLLNELFEVAETVVRGHPALSKYLTIT